VPELTCRHLLSLCGRNVPFRSLWERPPSGLGQATVENLCLSTCGDCDNVIQHDSTHHTTPEGISAAAATLAAVSAHADVCTIDVATESSLSVQRFEDEYWEQKPLVIIRDMTTTNSAARQAASADALRSLAEASSTTITVASPSSYPFANRRRRNASQFFAALPSAVHAMWAHNATFHFEEEGVLTESVRALYQPVGVVRALTAQGWRRYHQLAVGGLGAGISFHHHGAVTSETLHGRRRWLLYPPDRSPAFNARATSASWMHDVYPRRTPSDGLLECTLGPGASLYMPAMWFHSTVGLDNFASAMSVFYRHQPHVPPPTPAATPIDPASARATSPTHHALAKDSDTFDAWMSSVGHHYTRREWELCARAAKEFLRGYPLSFLGWSYLGVCQLKAKRARTAIVALQRCIERNPLFSPCHTWLGRAVDATERNASVAAAHRRMAARLTFLEDDTLL
jgi:hypothetical protein